MDESLSFDNQHERREELSSLEKLTEAEVRKRLGDSEDLPEIFLLEGEIQPDLLYNMSENEDREYGVVVSESGKRVMFRGPENEYTPSPSELEVSEELGPLKGYVHTHFPYIDMGDRLEIRKAPSSSDFRVSSRDHHSEPWLVVTGHEAWEFRAGSDVEDMDIEILLGLFGRNREDFEASEDDVMALLPHGQHVNSELMAIYKEDLSFTKLVKWADEAEKELSDDPDLKIEFDRRLVEKLKVDDPSEAEGRTYVRSVSKEELYGMLNPKSNSSI